MPGSHDVRPMGQRGRGQFPPHHPPRPRRGHQLRRHRRRVLRRCLRGDRRQGSQGPPRGRLPGDEVLHADGPGRPQPARRLPALDHPRGRELPASPRHRPHRPLPGPPPQPRHGRRGDPRRPVRPRPPGKGPLHRLLVLLRLPDRRSPMDLVGTPAGAVRDRAATVLAPGPRHRGRRPAHRAPPRNGHPHLQPALRRLALGTLPQERHRGPRVRGPPPRPAST